MRDSYLLLTYDSCRYDVLVAAATPVLDSFATVVPAQAPANFTYASHHAMFVGILPNADDDVPLLNRFRSQLIGLTEVGETNVAKNARQTVTSDWNVVAGLRDTGYRTIGAGAMNWFRQASLTEGFERFCFTGTDADAQVDFVLSELDAAESGQPTFAFVNFGETHAPFAYAGKATTCPVDVRARRMTWPPTSGAEPVGASSPAFAHQVEAAEFLDGRLGRLLSGLDPHTTVVLCADHGECFGEDGYWGHGVNHAKVLEVPLAVFRLDGTDPA